MRFVEKIASSPGVTGLPTVLMAMGATRIPQMKHGRPQLGACLDLAWGGCQNKFVRWPTIALAARPVKAAGKVMKGLGAGT